MWKKYKYQIVFSSVFILISLHFIYQLFHYELSILENNVLTGYLTIAVGAVLYIYFRYNKNHTGKTVTPLLLINISAYLSLFFFDRLVYGTLLVLCSCFSYILVINKKIVFYTVIVNALLMAVYCMHLLLRFEVPDNNVYMHAFNKNRIPEFIILIFYITSLYSFFFNIKHLLISKHKDLDEANREIINEILKADSIEKQLADEKIKYDTLFEQSLDTILILKEERIVSCNRQAMTLFKREKEGIINKKPDVFFAEEQPNNWSHEKFAFFIKKADSGKTQRFEWTFTDPKERLLYTEVSLQNITLNNIVFLQCIIRNIGHRKETELVLEKYRSHLEAQVIARTTELQQINSELINTVKQLNESNSMKSRLLSVIGHDLRNPFNNIISFAALIEKRIKNTELQDVFKYAEHISISAQNSYALLENLLQWAQNQNGNIHYSPKQIDVCHVLNRVIALLHAGINNKNISLDLECNKKYKIKADPRMFETILRNLVSNAIKFTPENGKITIKSLKQDDAVIVAVSDSGKGVGSKTIDNLMNSTTNGTNGESGTGLGLSLCKEFVLLNNGTISVKKSELGGAEFIISIPDYSEIEAEHSSII